ncbi:MAG: L-histidine N(alpha)-methyltransferase, partial [Gemmatimonadaceae bacterium]
VDPGDLAFEVRSDRTTARVEAHLVARRALTLTLPDDSRLALPAGETIRTIVAAPSDHKRVAATLRGCSLDLHAWHEDASGRAAVAIATPSSVV